MKLNIPDRLLLLGVIPKQGNFLTLKIVKDLIDKISFSSKELEEYQLTEKNGQVNWKADNTEHEKDIEISDPEKVVIIDSLKTLDGKKELTLDMLRIYDKFINKL
jgi:hypothetical protein